MSERTEALADAGLSVWLDDLSREWIDGRNGTGLVNNESVEGETTPTSFVTLSDCERGDEQKALLVRESAPVDEVVWKLVAWDLRDACVEKFVTSCAALTVRVAAVVTATRMKAQA